MTKTELLENAKRIKHESTTTREAMFDLLELIEKFYESPAGEQMLVLNTKAITDKTTAELREIARVASAELTRRETTQTEADKEAQRIKSEMELKVVECPQCGGSGWADFATNKPCPNCKGY